MTRVNKGIRFEYKIRDKYRALGYYVIRSAGSHGAYDLVCIHPQKREVLLLQLKRGSKAYINSFDKPNNNLSGENYTVKEEIIKQLDG